MGPTLEVRAVAQPQHQPRCHQCQHGGCAQGDLPGGQATQPARTVRQRRAQRQHAHQPGQCRAGPRRHPADHQLHAQRVNAGQAHADRHAQGQSTGHVGRQPGKGRIEAGTQHGTHGKDAAGRKAVGQPGQGKQQRTDNEAQLHAIGQRADIARRDAPAAHQIIGGAVGRKPERGAEQLGRNDHKDRVLHGDRFCNR